MDTGNRVIKDFLWNISAENIASLLASRMDVEVDGHLVHIGSAVQLRPAVSSS